jgi:hypothetical protein
VTQIHVNEPRFLKTPLADPPDRPGKTQFLDRVVLKRPFANSLDNRRREINDGQLRPAEASNADGKQITRPGDPHHSLPSVGRGLEVWVSYQVTEIHLDWICLAGTTPDPMNGRG